MTENVTWINPDRSPGRYAGFVETESARKMLLSLRSARAAGEITMIMAGSGVGKSTVKRQFLQEEEPKSIILNIAPDQSGQWGLSQALCHRLSLKEPIAINLPKARREIAEAIGPGGFVILDEAQYLIREGEGRGKHDFRAFEWARMLQEEVGFGLAFIGDTSLDRVLARYPQIRRRTHPRVRIEGTTFEDAEAFLQAYGLTEEKAVRKLASAVRGQGGGLGALHKIKETAWDMCDNRPPQVDDWLASLHFFEKGFGE